MSVVFEAKFHDSLKNEIFEEVDKRVWKKDWVVDCEPVGTGEAAFKYLAPYVFRVAISNRRIVKLEDGRVTFKYKDSATDQMKQREVNGEEFIRRFLQHVLPEGFVKVRYYGLLSAGNRHLLERAREILNRRNRDKRSEQGVWKQTDLDGSPAEPVRCPTCGSEMTPVRTLKPKGPRPL